VTRRLAVALRLWAAAFCLGYAAYAHPQPWQSDRPAASFDRGAAIKSPALADIKQAGTLRGAVGWFEYDFEIPEPGWYELFVGGHAASLEILVDPQGSDGGKAAAYVPASFGFNGKDDKIGNFHFARGRHTVRLQRYYWTGFPDITRVALKSAEARDGAKVRVVRAVSHGIYKRGGCGALEIEYGPRTEGMQLPVQWINAATQRPIRGYTVALPATAKPARLKWPIPCDDAGEFTLYFNDGTPRITNRDVHQFNFEVIDTRAGGLAAGGVPQKTLVGEIDLTAAAPDYVSGETRVVNTTAGSYRESGTVGWLEYQRSRIKLSPPSWFAYVLKGVTPQVPHLVEIDYPDDAERTFVIALREANPLSYPVAGGVDSGGEYAVTGRMQKHTLVFWPRARDPRIVFLPANNSQPAAAARIRIYRIEGGLPPLVAAQKGGRSFANWYEEGSNFLSMYGAPGEGAASTRTAIERWGDAIAYMGGDTLWPTVAVYSFALYPSRLMVDFSQPWTPDTLRQILLVAESRGLKVIPELHPRPDVLGWPYLNERDPKANLLVSATGQTRNDLPPFLNPLHPGNQDWYVGLVGELADRYRDSPALRGISLRFMQWKNPALHNFHSLDWGYDDLTVGMFEKETGIRVPADPAQAGRFAVRHRWLMANAREAWISWRCRKIAQLLTRIRDRARAARPDLTIYLPVFPMTEAGDVYHTGTEWLREAGFDIALLSKIDGVELVNAMHVYGRRLPPRTNALLRTHITKPAEVRGLLAPGKPPLFLPTAAYFEANESFLPPEQLGFPANTKRTWMAGVVNPAGRGYLERYALLLAETDAMMLGDGGNAYSLGQPELREFLAEFRRLPAVAFRPRPEARQPVAVWELERGDDYIFYAVNRTARPAEIAISFPDGAAVTRLSGEAVEVRDGVLRLELKPFQLAAYRTARRHPISRISAR
jgi:hypothetical protein